MYYIVASYYVKGLIVKPSTQLTISTHPVLIVSCVLGLHVVALDVVALDSITLYGRRSGLPRVLLIPWA